MDHQFSEEDAQRIFALAAERQKTAEVAHDKKLTLAELEEAGLAAGIDPAYIRAAAADLLRPDRVNVHRTFAGLPVEVRSTRLYATPIDEEKWTALVLRLRDLFGKEGLVTSFGKVRQWQSEADERRTPVRVMVEEENGGARVTIERKTWPKVLGASFGVGGFTVAWTIIMLQGLLSGNTDAAWIGVGMVCAALIFAVVGFLRWRNQGEKMQDKYDAVFASLEQQGLAQADPLQMLEAMRPGVPRAEVVREDEVDEQEEPALQRKRVRG